MEEVSVKIISNAECNKGYSDRITEGMLCAGEGDGKDTCNGHSGGPLIENDVLVGIVSWGGKCGVNAGVYTRISYVLDYINDVVNGGTGSSFTESVAGSTSEDKSSSTSTDTTDAPSTDYTDCRPSTEAPTLAPTVTEAPGTEAPQTESPTTDSEDAYAPSTDSAEYTEPSSKPAQQSEPNATEVPTPASGIKTQSLPVLIEVKFIQSRR
ncbi:hypothetical protein PI125_g21053 [Phytophthora idaei]|nr:hypothetical protein PI125_g21053 [Phytophthora idaei]